MLSFDFWQTRSLISMSLDVSYSNRLISMVIVYNISSGRSVYLFFKFKITPQEMGKITLFIQFWTLKSLNDK